MAVADITDEIPAAEDRPRQIHAPRSRGDRIFQRVAVAAGSSSLVIMGFIALFLLLQGMDAFREAGFGFFTTFEWQTNTDPPRFGVAAMLYGTFVVAVIALVVAVPVAIATALFINELAPRRLRRPLTTFVDLLAAIPSLIFGIWAREFLQNELFGVSNWFADYLAFLPVFEPDQRVFAGSLFVSGLVVSLMVLPISTSVIREVFSQTPPLEREGALALGSTRWGMIRTVVLPFGRGGIIGGSMLGLGRALGETIAVAIILSPSYKIQTHILEPGGATVAATIANEFSEATPLGVSALMAAGLVLFVITLLVNMLANVVVSRSRSGAGVEI
ncbi:MAG: phosphate ABC transporter permease subunit PstC [Acidimicrobiales bacterium]|nr:phosphate ABC transporter permease subunit PstC [Acidimicrobiales bacterium]